MLGYILWTLFALAVVRVFGRIAVVMIKNRNRSEQPVWTIQDKEIGWYGRR